MSPRCIEKKSIRSIGVGYHIVDRDDGHDDDNGSSRVWPSRTSWGAAFSLAEKFGFLFERKYGIAAYDYWWGYTSCQIELMIMDQPIISYGEKKAKKSTRSEMDALSDAWYEKRCGRTVVGKKVDLNEFLRG